MVFWTAWQAQSFLWGDGNDPWSQYATSTINFWTLHHHSGCISNGWRSGGGWHGRELLRILAWDKLWEEKSYSFGTRKRTLYSILSSSPFWIKKDSLKTPLWRVFWRSKRNTVEGRPTDQKGHRNILLCA